jgi:CRISPR-associated protein Cmr3
MSQIYLVTLTPQEAFFFGGEQTFGKDDSRKDGSRYSAISTHFAQQTALLGMLRKTLLIQNKNLTLHLRGEWVDSKGKNSQDSNYDEARRVAGSAAFSYDTETDLGIIETISPMFIQKKDISYVVDAKDKTYQPKIASTIMMLNGSMKDTFILNGFDAKEHKEDAFIGTDKSVLQFDDVFKEVQSVGIKKTEQQEENEDGFFQKKSFILKDKATFAFYMQLSEDVDWSEAYVTLGADQSSFHMKIEKTDENFNTAFENLFEQKSIDRVIIHSETLVDETIYNSSLFVFGSRKPYRQLTNKKGKKSKRYYLLERGSVIYTKELEKLTAALAKPHLQKVGLNYFTPVEGL